MNLLKPIAYQWYLIGTALEIEDGDLKPLEQNPQYSSDTRKLAEVLQLWFDKRTTEVTWRKILSVVENPSINNLLVAGGIRNFMATNDL